MGGKDKNLYIFYGMRIGIDPEFKEILREPATEKKVKQTLLFLEKVFPQFLFKAVKVDESPCSM